MAMPKVKQEFKTVGTAQIQEHPQNPNKGAQLDIEESIATNGFYGAVIVQKSTGYILAGNHRWKAARSQGATKIPICEVDVDDDTALRILLVDNESTRKGEYDDEKLQEILGNLDSLEGTGFMEEFEREEAQREAEEAGKAKEKVPDDKHEAQYAVMVMCKSEEHQEQVYEFLNSNVISGKSELLEGAELRVVAV